MSPRQSQPGARESTARTIPTGWVPLTDWVLAGPENLIGHFQDCVRVQLGETA